MTTTSSRLQRVHVSLACLILGSTVAFAQGPPNAEPDPASGSPDEARVEAPNQRGLQVRAEGAFEGYTLLAPLGSRTTYLLDGDGEVVHSWQSEYMPGNSVYLLDDGSILRCARGVISKVFRGGGKGGRIQRIAWDGELLWDYVLADEERMHHHDIEPLPNGNVIVIAWEYFDGLDAIAAGRNPELLKERRLWPDCLLEIEPIGTSEGKVVWEWHSFDHLIQDRDPEGPNYGVVAEHPERIDINGDEIRLDEAEMDEETRRRLTALGYLGDDGKSGNGGGADWMHTNSVDWHPEYDLLMLSLRNWNEVWIIDHSTTTAEAKGSTGGRWGRGGDLLYRFGNPLSHGGQDPTQQFLFRQHDARWIEAGSPGTGNVLIFNNGDSDFARAWSTVDEYAIPFDPEKGFGEVDGTPLTPVWSYGADVEPRFFSERISGAQRLPNGNTLICVGNTGRVFEVDDQGEIVWDYLNPFGDPVVSRRPRPADQAGGPPADQGGPPPRRGGPGGHGGPGGGPPLGHGLFRAERLDPAHPGLSGLVEADADATGEPPTDEPEPESEGEEQSAISPERGPQHIAWYSVWEDARREAARTGKPILLVSAAPHCSGVGGMW
jgi:arylsulfotransferase ASST